MNKKDMDKIWNNSVPIEELGDDVEVLSDLAGYQVTKAELFSHTREPSITIWSTRVKFNMACLRKFPGVTHIQMLINPEQKRLIIRPSEPDAPDSMRWAVGGGDKEIKNRDMLCRIFAAKIFDLMGWDAKYRYKMLGKPAIYNGEILFLFKLTDFELFICGKKSKGSYLPGEWRDYFGTPVEKHEESYDVNLAEGYVATDKL